MKNKTLFSGICPTSLATAAIGLTATLLSTAASAQGGDTPATATPITSLGYIDSGTTEGYANDISTLPSGIGSPYTQVSGPDVFYTFSVATTGQMSFTVTPQAGYDVAIYLLKDGLLGTNAVQARDSELGGIAESLLNFTVLAGSTYYFGVDSFYISGSLRQGTYSLSVTGDAVLGSGSPGSVPEPGTLGLLAAGALAARRGGSNGLGWRARRGIKA